MRIEGYFHIQIHQTDTHNAHIYVKYAISMVIKLNFN